jgi:hypothetical protein
MQFSRFLSVKRDDKVFTEARELALLRLEQCIADLRMPIPALVLNSSPEATVSEKIINSLRAGSGRRMRITFSDGVVLRVVIGAVDKAGFLHQTHGDDAQVFWTRFEDVNALEAEN